MHRNKTAAVQVFQPMFAWETLTNWKRDSTKGLQWGLDYGGKDVKTFQLVRIRLHRFCTG